MAGRPKKTTTTTTTKKTTATATNAVNNNDANLESLLAQMQEMQRQIAELTHTNQELNKQIDTEVDVEEINADTDIPVVSQFRGKLNLVTAVGGTGNVYTFDEFGEVQDIPFGDLREICKICKRFAQEGAFYILNDGAIKKLRLKTYYDRNVSFEDMNNIDKLPSETVLELYKTASKIQQEEIIDYFKKKYENGESVDANILVGLQDLTDGKVDFFSNGEEEL